MNQESWREWICMITSVIELLIGIVLASLVVVNRIGMDKTKKRRQNLCWKYKRKTILGIKDNYSAKTNFIEDKDSLKMHNNGTDLRDEVDGLLFHPISQYTGTKMFWERKG